MRIDVDTERQVITVNGIDITYGLLDALTNPDESKVFRFVRRKNLVTITSHVSLTEYTPGGMKQ